MLVLLRSMIQQQQLQACASTSVHMLALQAAIL
jgi:hypothetical protein